MLDVIGPFLAMYSFILLIDILKPFPVVLKSKFRPEMQSASSILSNLDVLFS